MERLRVKTWSRAKEPPNVGLQKQVGSVGSKGRSAALDKSRQELNTRTRQRQQGYSTKTKRRKGKRGG